MLLGTQIITEPTEEPITLEEAKLHLKIDADMIEEDYYITMLIRAARKVAEKYLNRYLLTQTVKQSVGNYFMSDWKRCLLLRSPLQSVVNIDCISSEGLTTTIDLENIVVDSISAPPRYELKEGFYFPPDTKRIETTYIAGWTTPADVPDNIRYAILLILTYMYENRTDSVRKMPMVSEYLLYFHRVNYF